MTEQRISQDVLAERLVKIPPMVDMDSHVVEPPGVWRDRLTSQLRDAGPRIEYAPAGRVQLVDGKYVETPGTGGPEAAWWVFDGVRTQIKRYIASAGVPAEEVTNEGITYDDMRPGCWKPAERIADMDVNGVQAQMCFPNYPRFCGQIFLWAKDKHLARLCARHTTTGWWRSGPGGAAAG